MSGRTSAWAMRSEAGADAGEGSTDAVSTGTTEFVGNINVSRTNGEST